MVQGLFRLIDKPSTEDEMSFFCLSIPQFAAWALAHHDPNFRDCAFAVHQHGVIAAVSPQAHEAGVHCGMSVKKAQSLHKSLVLVERELDLEAQVWNDVQSSIYEISPSLEIIRPGLLFADLDARKTLALMQKWQAQAGQASDRATAHLAALTADKGEVRCVRKSREAPFADRVPIESLISAGISSSALEQLKLLGWKSVGALRVLTLKQLQEQVGREAEAVFRLTQGKNAPENLLPVRVLEPAEEVKAIHSFELPARDAGDWEKGLHQLVEQLSEDLGERTARTLELRLETPIISLAARRIVKSPDPDIEAVKSSALAAMEEALGALAPLPAVICSIEIKLGILSEAQTENPLNANVKMEGSNRASRWQNVLKNFESRIGNKKQSSEVVPCVQGVLPLFAVETAVTVMGVVEPHIHVVR